jgi:prepilin-type N-terminal cleavage/methylation domain-containing protein
MSRSERGFSIVELLVALGIVGVTLAGVVPFFALQARKMKSASYRLEAQQGMRASLDAMSRDIRLAGACLPTKGQFVALAGVDAAAGDQITVRSGIISSGTSCIKTTTTADVAQGASALPVNSTAGFTNGMLVFLSHPQGGGEIHKATSVSGNSITLDSGVSQTYPGPPPGGPSGVYALDERVYALDKSNPANPVLTLTVNRTAPQAFAAGVSDLQIRYTLNQNCPPCDTVNVPPDTATWWLVNDVVLTATVQTVGSVRPEDSVTIVETTRAKPRNLLP